MNAQLPEVLAERLQRPLPGARAYARMAPELSFGRQAGPAPHNARRAAVLLLLYPHEGAWHLPLTLRPGSLTQHAGQISLPGGMIERGESSRAAAKREMEEELGYFGPLKRVGKLSEFFVFVSNFVVTPWVAIAPQRPDWQPNPAEVEQVIELPVSCLLDTNACGNFSIERRGHSITAPCFTWQDHRIWGATSMILAELGEVLQEVGV